MHRSASRFAAAAVAVAALGLTSCSSGADGPSASGSSKEIQFYDTSGGQVWEELDKTLFKNFKDSSGITVVDDYNEASTKFFGAAEAGQVPWSLVFLPTTNDAERAAEAGMLQKLDSSKIPLDKLREGTYNEYGIEVGTFGMVLAWDGSAYPEAPTSMADLWDTEKFPGKRCFFNNPQYGWTLEAALLADGVSKDQLYPLDVPRALKKLDEIKSNITWWSSGAQSLEMFENGSCDIGIIWANRAFTAKSENGFDMNITWKDAGYSNSVWAIPAKAPNAEGATALLKAVIEDTDGQIAFASKVPTPIPAGVAGLTADKFPEEVRPFLPVGDTLEGAVKQDTDYYAKNGEATLDEFNRWVGK